MVAGLDPCREKVRVGKTSITNTESAYDPRFVWGMILQCGIHQHWST